MAKRLLLIALLGYLSWILWLAPAPSAQLTRELGQTVNTATHFDPALTIQQPPIQQPLNAAPFTIGDYQFIPKARFQIEARILGHQTYRFDRLARVSPIDLALGWGPMARDEVLEAIRIRQSNRFYYWSTRDFPIPRRDIERHSANMHLIPVGDSVARALRRSTVDQQIRIHGYLVDIHHRNGHYWRTSLTRDDTGAGACEIILVTLVSILPS